MKIRHFVAGLLVGVGGTAVGLSFADGVAGRDTPFCELVVTQDARLKTTSPTMSHYTLHCRGRDVGLIAADENGIESVYLCDKNMVTLQPFAMSASGSGGSWPVVR